MVDTDKLDAYKKEIRSLLISYQKGCYLSEFNNAYSEFIGKRLPFKEMGFATDIEFLKSMPDVVRITPAAHSGYHLMGVADDKSKHIQKMVAKQKPAKFKPPPPSFRNTKSPRFNTLPPRFIQASRIYDPTSRIKAYLKEPERLPTTLSKEKTKLFITMHRDESKLSTVSLHREESKLSTVSLHREESKLSTASSQREGPKLLPNASPMQEVIELVHHFKNRLALDDLLCQYNHMYRKSLSLSAYGFSSIDDCINDIPGLEIVEEGNVKFVRSCSEKQAALNNNDEKDEHSVKVLPTEVPSSCNSEYSYKRCCDNGNFPASLEEKLLKVAKRCSVGILASDFPRYFEEVTGHTLELASLGYRCLNDLIDSIPDTFVRVPVSGSKKDSLIYSAEDFKLGQNETVHDELALKFIVSNLRRILVAYPEGIKVQDFSNVYSLNCKDSLHIKDFGFDDLEKFLSNIKSDVPLRFGSMNGEKSIHLVKLSEEIDDSSYMAPEAYDREVILFDAVFPKFQYKFHTFSSDFDFSLFVPAYTSSIAHPGCLYLQFVDNPELSDKFAKLAKEIDNFYDGSQSEQYIMKPIHIEIGASCIAKWPSDNHWYRAQILSIPSMQNVRVFYVDYGTTDTIPKFLLRYAKREFIDLPMQAVRCRLAFLKPPNNSPKWDIQTRNRILQLCQDVPLMAKIEEIGPDGIYTVILCDTNGKDDVYINDVLINEELAESAAEPPESNHTAPESKTCTEPPLYLHPLQALQAQTFLHAFAAVAPVFAQNELYLGLLKKVTAFCQNTDTISQGTRTQFATPVVPPGFNTFPVEFANSTPLFNAYPNAAADIATNPVRKSKDNTIFPSKDFHSTSIESSLAALAPSLEISPEENGDIKSEIFDDDDDEIFQQFLQKVSLTSVRHVKRVMLGDGYKIHIIVIDSQAYASSGEISQLIWNNKEADYLLCRLQLKEVDIPVVTLSEDGNEQLFHQLLKFNVKGVQKTNGFKSSIVLYSLKDVMKILNIFGHPSVTLRRSLIKEISSFNPNDEYWSENIEFSADSAESEDESSLSSIAYSSATDDDKIEKLCLHDLLAMKDSIVCKRKMLSSTNLSKSTDEIGKLEQLLQKVLNRIQEIKTICQDFS